MRDLVGVDIMIVRGKWSLSSSCIGAKLEDIYNQID